MTLTDIIILVIWAILSILGLVISILKLISSHMKIYIESNVCVALGIEYNPVGMGWKHIPTEYTISKEDLKRAWGDRYWITTDKYGASSRMKFEDFCNDTAIKETITLVSRGSGYFEVL